MESWQPGLHALALLIAANATPVVIAKLFGTRRAAPMDFGHVMADGERLFGAHKTWRGFLAGVIAGSVTAALLGLSAAVGAGFAAVSLSGDAVSSLTKRRMRLNPGTEFVGLDQLGEALLPLLLFAAPLDLDVGAILIVTAVFIAFDVAVAPLRHWARDE